MKQCRDVHALVAFSQLRAAGFARLVTYLRESRAELLEELVMTSGVEQVARAQGAIAALGTILKYVDEGESLAAKYQK